MTEKNKFKATWVSYSSISDYLKCPRAYYLANVYKDPDTYHKITIINPALALGQIVHEVLESLSKLPAEKRFKESLLDRYEQLWQRVKDRAGCFTTEKEEKKYKERGKQMIKRVIENPGPLLNKAIRIKKDVPNYYLSEDDDIILCGKIDWLEYVPNDDSLHLIDFKTGKYKEKDNSLQLPIYLLLSKNCQSRKITKVSYWYLNKNNEPTEVKLPNPQDAYMQVLDIAKKIKIARQNREFKCPRSGCYACNPYENILNGKGTLVGIDSFNRDIYTIKNVFL